MAAVAGSCFVATVMVAALLSVGNGSETRAAAASAQVVRHVVGDDLGWDLSSNVAAWAKNRIFRVGDEIWFAYAAAEEGVVELESRDEVESCNLANPIAAHTSGLDRVSLHSEGPRYFASANQESCKSGLKLQVQVDQPPRADDSEQMKELAVADVEAAPPQPSGLGRLRASSQPEWVAHLLFVVALGFLVCNSDM